MLECNCFENLANCGGLPKLSQPLKFNYYSIRTNYEGCNFKVFAVHWPGLLQNYHPRNFIGKTLAVMYVAY